MLSTLTTYLLQHKQVAIPFIGSFEMRRQPAALDFANRLLVPPASEIVYHQNDTVSEQQIAYLSEATSAEEDEVTRELQLLGQQLKDTLAHQSFEWKGIGRLEQGVSGLVFESTFQNKLKPVEAYKVMRENVSHAVTIGDKEMQSHEAAELLQEAPPKSYLMIIIWVLIVLALLFIGYLFYTKGFSPLSSGSQQRFGYLWKDLAHVC